MVGTFTPASFASSPIDRIFLTLRLNL
jgi:hypothetical protein